jgi:hypothetical protein
VWDAVRCVYYAFCGLRGRRRGLFVPVDGKGGALPGRRCEERVGRKGDEESRVVVEGVLGRCEARYAEPRRQREERTVVPVGGFGREGGCGDDGAEMTEARYEFRSFLCRLSVRPPRRLCRRAAHLCRKHGHVPVHLEQRVLVAVVRKLVRYRHSVNQRLGVCAARRPQALLGHAQSAREHLHLQRQLVDLGDAAHGALGRVPLLREPPGHVRLAALQPRVDEDVVVDAAAVFDGRGGARNLQEPTRVGVEMVQHGPARGEGAHDGVAHLEVYLRRGRVHVGVLRRHGASGGDESWARVAGRGAWCEGASELG